eukprot:919132-Alexandrium_andersonii.AAC.1
MPPNGRNREGDGPHRWSATSCAASLPRPESKAKQSTSRKNNCRPCTGTLRQRCPRRSLPARTRQRRTQRAL